MIFFGFLYLKRCLTIDDGVQFEFCCMQASWTHQAWPNTKTCIYIYIYINCCELDNKLIRFICTIVKWRQLNQSAQTETREFKTTC